jgi:type IV secretory pathway VirB6-like protein
VPAIILQAIVSFFILAFGIFAFIDVQVISQSIVIVLAFGPLFLAGFAFESTAKWAEGWLTAAVKYVIDSHCSAGGCDRRERSGGEVRQYA